MNTKQLKALLPENNKYLELKVQSNKSQSMAYLNGSLVHNDASSSSGLMARAFHNGMWGTASSPIVSKEKMKQVIKKATSNSDYLVKKMDKGNVSLPAKPAKGDYIFSSDKPKMTTKAKAEFLQEVDNYIAEKYTDLDSRYVAFSSIEMEKSLVTNDGAELNTLLPRSVLVVMMTVVHNNEPLQNVEIFGSLGQFEEVLKEPKDFFSSIDEVYNQLMEKKKAVFAKAGTFDCVLGPKLAGILAHEAIGHTAEADIVLNGSIAMDYLGRQVASPLVTLVDVANHYQGKICPVPVFIDDEGTEASDCSIIEKGVLKRYLTSKETAYKLGHQLTGNARGYAFSDEPIVRMRNTMIVPGVDKLDDMISSIENGYYLIDHGNGQADYTSEFMFGVTLGYEIRNGKIANPIKETTISGIAFDLLKTVSMVSDDLFWVSHGMCGKKQPIPVGMGGPAIKCKVNIGGKQ